MTASTDHAWAVLEIVAPAPMGRHAEVQALVARALASASIPEVRVVRGSPSGRVVLRFAPETAFDVIAASFVDALAVRLGEHNRCRAPDQQLRLAVALHPPGSPDEAGAFRVRLPEMSAAPSLCPGPTAGGGSMP